MTAKGIRASKTTEDVLAEVRARSLESSELLHVPRDLEDFKAIGVYRAFVPSRFRRRRVGGH